MRFDLLRLLFCISGLGCGGATPPADPAPIRLLFIGNSLMYTNELPLMVQNFLRLATTTPIEVHDVAYPNFGLTEHRELGEAVTAIRQGGWDLVVMQQGPSSLPDSRLQLVAEARWFASEVRQAGGTPALLMAWPSTTYFGSFDAVRDSYRLAADSAGAIFLGAGEAWRAAWRRDSTLPLYDKDGFHPSPMGSYLAALVVAGWLEPRALDQAPDSMVVAGLKVGVPPAAKPILVDAAREVLGSSALILR